MNYEIGTELRSPHGNRWVKVADNAWQVRREWGTLDEWTLYTDNEVFGEVIAAGVTK